jgi:YbbR domain-containing protein
VKKAMLHRNLEWKLTALVLAIGLWAYVTVNERVGEKTFRVPIEVEALPNHLALVTAPGQATIILKGDKSDLEAATDQVRARASLPAIKAAILQAKIQTQFPPELELVQVRPEQISLRFEKIVAKTLPITAHLKGEPSPGYTIGTPQVTPAQGRVYGAQSAVARVARLMVGVDIASALLGLPQSGLVYPVEASGQQVAGVTLEPQTAVVSLPITSDIASRTLPVFPELTGTPAEGWQVKSITIEPSQVTVTGEALAIKDLPGIKTLPVSLNKLSGSFNRKVNLIIPEGVASVSDRTVLIRVKIAPAPSPPLPNSEGSGGEAPPIQRPEEP